jgi:uncharacterized protein (TIGR02453 family)
MTELVTFSGFPQETITFYQDLARNNDKVWFDAHKQDYKHYVLAPAQDFVVAMGERLRTIAPDIVMDTRTNGAGSIFRIYRDTRFSKDKTPYKPFLGIFFWEGARKKMENSGFYFHLEPPRLMLAAGMYMFCRPTLEKYRQAVIDPKLGVSLIKAVEQVEANGPYEISTLHYKRVPRGFDSNHENARFLRFNGLSASIESDIPEEIHSPDILDYCLARFQDMAPLHRWLVKMAGPEAA